MICCVKAVAARVVMSPTVEVSFDSVASLCVAGKEEEKVVSVRGWAFEVERLFTDCAIRQQPRLSGLNADM